ncbi:MAG: Gfo/Idh/MocA family oxidoreductase [Succinivibrio sp.]|nr:Gfo/Idh/MocA family oxidoreductase [Succinivibrio sp.]
MKVLIAGLGSMGKRRLRLLRSLGHEVYGIEAKDERRAEVAAELKLQTFPSLHEAIQEVQPEALCVCTPPLTHAAIIGEGLEAGLHVFSELNLVNSGYTENLALAAARNKVLFLSSTLLYRREISWIRRQVSQVQRRPDYLLHVGQYLPDWHPWDQLNDFFISKRRTNGCREILAIQLPWLIKTFGEIDEAHSAHRQASVLGLDFDDVYHLTLEHDSGTQGSFVCEVLSRPAAFNLEIFGEGLYIRWDGTPQGLYAANEHGKGLVRIDLYPESEDIEHKEGYAPNIIENAYKTELETFISCIAGTGTPRYDWQDDVKTLALIDEIEGVTGAECNDGTEGLS